MAPQAHHCALAPPEVIYRPKMGFVLPLPRWFHGELGMVLEGLMNGSVAARDGWIDSTRVMRELEDHRQTLYTDCSVEKVKTQMIPQPSYAETRRRPLRIAYFAEIFPSKSETWVHHEIIALQRLGSSVRVFATHPKPENVPSELTHFFGLTTYLPELRSEWLACMKTLGEPSLLKPVLAGVIRDTPSFRLKAQVIRDLIYASKFFPAVSHFNPDVFFAHFAGTRANIALFSSLISEVPFAIKMHASDVFGRCARFRLKTTRAAHILTISDYNINFMRRHYPDVSATRFDRHACGIPLHEYPFQPVQSINGTPIIMAVGRLVRMKGFDVLLRASRILLNREFQHRVVILGDGPERTSLERLRVKLSLDEVVELKGHASPNEVRKMLRTAALFVLPAIWDPIDGTQDGVPVALMEAIALGVPVVSTTISGIPELIQDGVNGLLVAPNDADALAQQIKYGCEMSGDARVEMLRRARQKIETDHDIEKLTAHLLKMFEGIKCAG